MKYITYNDDETEYVEFATKGDQGWFERMLKLKGKTNRARAGGTSLQHV
jgi:hypothetical protein